MQSLTEGQLLFGLLALAIILVVGRGTAELARRLGQPEVLGELFGGFLLGPSVFGAAFPAGYHTLFLDGGIGLGLSLLSWIGAILLLLMAGMEVDLGILRAQAMPGALAAACAIVPSLAVGTLFSWLVLGNPLHRAFFLGIVLSVTAVSVAAKVLLERGTLRRGYAQVILAAGIASEVLVWLLIAVASAWQSGSPLLTGLRDAVIALAFLVAMMTIGRRVTFWAMRRVADMTSLIKGRLTLVLMLAFVAAALTQRLGLHALLGAFVFGMLLGQAPRANVPLKESVQTLTVTFFAPIFFVLAGMRVDIFKLGSPAAIGAVLLLFAVATPVKAGLGALGARLGGLRGWEPALVGVGLNLKGGTDVIVAILTVELGALSTRVYTMYAVVAMLTVLLAPPLMRFLEARTPPTPEEQGRLEREEGKRRSFVPQVERVLVPVMPQLLSTTAAGVVERIAATKHAQGEIFDITEFNVAAAAPAEVEVEEVAAVAQADALLSKAGQLAEVKLTQRRVGAGNDALGMILEASRDHDLIALGARRPEPTAVLSLGDLQDRIVDQVEANVLVVVEGDAAPAAGGRILVPVNGLEYSMAAGDVAAYLARTTNAEIVLFNAMRPAADAHWRQEAERRRLFESGHDALRELTFRLQRLEVPVSERVVLAEHAGTAIVRELERGSYHLVVLGAVDRGRDNRLNLGSQVQTVLTGTTTPAVLLITHE